MSRCGQQCPPPTLKSCFSALLWKPTAILGFSSSCVHQMLLYLLCFFLHRHRNTWVFTLVMAYSHLLVLWVLKNILWPSFIRASWLRICLQCKRSGFVSWVRKIPWRRKWQSSPVFLPGKSHGQRSLAGYSPWRLKESDTTEWLNHHHQFYCVTCSCLLLYLVVLAVLMEEFRENETWDSCQRGHLHLFPFHL